jgi:hypothetical protein
MHEAENVSSTKNARYQCKLSAYNNEQDTSEKKLFRLAHTTESFHDFRSKAKRLSNAIAHKHAQN